MWGLTPHEGGNAPFTPIHTNEICYKLQTIKQLRMLLPEQVIEQPIDADKINSGDRDETAEL